MTSTHVHRLMRVIAATVAGLPWAPGAWATPNPALNQVTDPSFDAGPLQSFARTCGNPYTPGEWNAENADLIVGPSAGVTPDSPNGMLRVNATGGSASQVNQIIDVTSCAADVDGGSVVARFSIQFNSPAAGVTPSLLFQAGASQTCVGTLNLVGGSPDDGYNRSKLQLAADGDPGTWERIAGAIVLPSGTRFLEIQFWAPNSQIPAGGVFFDTASVTLEPCEQLVDNGFDSGTGPLQSFARTCGNPYTPGEWNAENANLIVGPSAGVSPFFGDGMLRVNATGGVGSQVNQIVDLSDFAEAIDNGNVAARFFSWFNAAAGGAEPRVLLEAGESQTCVGTLVPVGGTSLSGYNLLVLPTTADGNSATWEALGSDLWLPPGTRFLQYQIAGVNATIPGTGLFFDEASVCLRSSLPSFGLSHTTLGQAQLDEDGSGNLIITNIGSSGQDGVAINLGEAEGYGTELMLDPPNTPLGAFMETRTFGILAGAAGQPTGSLRVTRSAGGYTVLPDFSDLGSPTYTVEIFSGGALVHSQSGLSGAAVQMNVAVAGSSKCWCDPEKPTTDKTKWKWRKAQLTEYVVDGTTVSGDRIEFSNDTPHDPTIVQTRVEVVAADTPDILILDEALVQFGTMAQGLGDAILQGTENGASLIITNIGSSGQDGVRYASADVENDQFGSVAAAWDPPVPGGDPADSEIHLGVTGFFGGVEQTLGNVAVKDNIVNDNLRVTPDFSPIGSTLADVAVFSAGAQVALVSGFNVSTGTIDAANPGGGAAMWPTATTTSIIDKSTGSARGPGDPFNGLDVSLTWNQQMSFVITGLAPVLGDEIRVQPQSPSATFEGLESAEILLTDFQTMTLTNAAVVPPPACVGSLDGDDDTDVLDFAVFAANFGSTGLLPFSAGDFDGDGDVDVLDFASFASDFGCGSS